jgi:PmbA protein
MGNSRGFRGGFASAHQSLAVGAIASEPGQQGDDMQRDAWYSTQRRAQDLASPEAVGRYAAERALSRLNGRKISTCEVPVLFESTEALGLMGNYVRATGGVRLYQKSSFLLDTLGLEVMAPHLDLCEDPHQLRGLASAPFDEEGVITRPRDVVKAGVVQGYFLSTYSARKLGMRTTGHAGGSHNLVLRSRLTQASDNLEAMLRKLHRGLFVTDQLGQGVNYVTGDYSRGAAGFWVEDGRIAYPVHEVTIAGNLKNIFKQIVAVGADTFTQGGYTSGSVLVERMKIAGS